jgi:hypothetical protein
MFGSQHQALPPFLEMILFYFDSKQRLLAKVDSSISVLIFHQDDELQQSAELIKTANTEKELLSNRLSDLSLQVFRLFISITRLSSFPLPPPTILINKNSVMLLFNSGRLPPPGMLRD